MAFTPKMIMTLAVLSSASMFADEAGDVEITTIATKPKAQDKPKMASQMSTKPQAQTQAQATSRQEFLPNMVAPNNWRLTGGFVYFLPSVDDTDFVYVQDTSEVGTQGKAESNDFGFAPGFRFGVEYALGHKYKQVQVFYTQLNSDQHRTVEGTNLYALSNAPFNSSENHGQLANYSGTAESRVHQFYQSFDFSYAQRLMNCAVLNDAGLCFYLRPGLEYTRLNFVQQNEYTGAGGTAEFKDKSKLWGVGPSIALAMDYNVFKGALYTNGTHALAVNVMFSGAVLASDQRASTTVTTTLASESVYSDHIQKTWRLIPAFHARAGLNYLMRGQTYAFNLGVGYEFNSYNRAVYRQRIFPTTGYNIAEYTNYDLQGLVVTGSFAF